MGRKKRSRKRLTRADPQEAYCRFPEAMIAGKLNCSVECNPIQGEAAFDAVEKIVAGETIPKTSYIKDSVFDQSVAKDVIGTRKY